MADITYGTAQEFESGRALYCQCCEIDTNKFVVVYADADDGVAGKARVGTVVGTVITWGPISEFCSAVVGYQLGVCKLDTDKFAVVYADDVLDDDGYARVGTVSGTTISWGTAKEFHDTDVEYPSCCQLGTDKFAIVYNDETGGDLGTVCICTVSNSTITAGTPVAFEGYIQDSRCCKLDTDKLVAFYCDFGDSSKAKACAFTVVGTVPTAGTIKEIDPGGGPGTDEMECCQLDTDKFVIAWQYYEPVPVCVAADSEIMTPDGSKRADAIRDGDRVVSYNPKTKEFSNRQVVEVQRNVEPYLLINGALKTGYDHPVWCNGEFISANKIKVGDILLDSNGQEQAVSSIENHVEPVETCDFVLDEPHTFFADGYLVHNLNEVGKVEICTVSGTTITEGAEVEFNSGTTYCIGLAKIDGSHFVITYKDGGNASKGTSRYCSFSGTIITLDGEEIFNDASTNYTDVCLISSNKIAVVYQDDGDVNDIGEAIIGDAPAAGWTGKISGVTNPAKIMGIDVANIAKVKGVASA